MRDQEEQKPKVGVGVMIFKDGKPIDQMMGVQDKNSLIQKFDKII